MRDDLVSLCHGAGPEVRPNEIGKYPRVVTRRAFCLKSSFAFAKVKQINMIRLSTKEIGSSSAPRVTDVRVARNDDEEAR